jgi:hypothetical protein
VPILIAEVNLKSRGPAGRSVQDGRRQRHEPAPVRDHAGKLNPGATRPVASVHSGHFGFRTFAARVCQGAVVRAAVLLAGA